MTPLTIILFLLVGLGFVGVGLSGPLGLSQPIPFAPTILVLVAGGIFIGTSIGLLGLLLSD